MTSRSDQHSEVIAQVAENKPDSLDCVDKFFSHVRTRLLAGRRAYGDRSFSADPKMLIDELQQEVLDLAGWGYVLFRRLEAMRVALRYSEIQSEGEPMPSPAARADDAPLDRWTHLRPPSEPPAGRLVGYNRGRDAITEPEQIP